MIIIFKNLKYVYDFNANLKYLIKTVSYSFSKKPLFHNNILSVNLKNFFTFVKKPGLKPEIKHLIIEGTKEQQLLGIVSVRKLLSIEKNPPIQDVIDSGLVSKFVEFLDSNSPELQFETAWALTNILSGNTAQTNFVIEQGAVPKLIRMMESENEEVQGQAIWALGNVAGDDHKNRDLVLQKGILAPLIK